jgi:hypothetical protein
MSYGNRLLFLEETQQQFFYESAMSQLTAWWVLRAAPPMLSMYVAVQQYFSHPIFNIYFFPTSPIKLKLGLQKVGDY